MKLVIEMDLENMPVDKETPRAVAMFLLEWAWDLTSYNIPGGCLSEAHKLGGDALCDEWTTDEVNSDVWFRAKTSTEAFDNTHQARSPVQVTRKDPDGSETVIYERPKHDN